MLQLKTTYYTSDDYWNLPEGEHAELINGQLYMMAPPNRLHQKILSDLHYQIKDYIKQNNGSCEVYPAPFAVNLTGNDKTWVEPDISVICDKNKLSDRGCEGAPDWIIEIVSPSSQGHDYLQKLLLYQKSDVKEYWIVNPMKRTVMVYKFVSGDHDATAYSFCDVIPVGIYDDNFTICLEHLL